MYDAMRAVSHRAIAEISRGSSTEEDENSVTPKRPFLRRAAFRIAWLLVLALRNTSTTVTPPDLQYSGGLTAISRLVTEDERLTHKQNLKMVCEVPDCLRHK